MNRQHIFGDAFFWVRFNFLQEGGVRVSAQVNRHGAIWAITQVHSANTICTARVLSRDSRDDKCDSLDLPSGPAAVTLIRALVGHLGDPARLR